MLSYCSCINPGSLKFSFSLSRCCTRSTTCSRHLVPKHRDRKFVWKIVCAYLGARTKFRSRCLGSCRGQNLSEVREMIPSGLTRVIKPGLRELRVRRVGLSLGRE